MKPVRFLADCSGRRGPEREYYRVSEDGKVERLTSARVRELLQEVQR